MSKAFWEGFLRGLSNISAVMWAWAVIVPLFAMFAVVPVPWYFTVMSAVCWICIIGSWVRRWLNRDAKEAAEDAPVHIDIERMQRALAGPSITVPSGLTRDELRQFIKDAAAGKVRPHVPAVPAAPPTLETARRVMEEHADVLRALKDR